MSRVKKRSFLLATILVPLIFPAVIGGMIYFKLQEEKNKKQEVVQVLNESDLITLKDTKDYKYLEVEGPLDSAKAKFNKSSDFALIYIPEITIDQPEGVSFYAKTTPGVRLVEGFEGEFERQIRDLKLTRSGLTEEQLNELKTNVSITSFNLSETGDEEKSDSNVIFGLGYFTGFLIYIFLFVYGGQVMQGVIEEKSSKIVEVIVSTVRPFQMMVGKVVGVASVGIVLLLSAPPVIAAMFVGLLISLFQAATQIQEQTLSIVPKIIAVYVVLVAFGLWTLRQTVSFALQLLQGIGEVG